MNLLNCLRARRLVYPDFIFLYPLWKVRYRPLMGRAQRIRRATRKEKGKNSSSWGVAHQLTDKNQNSSSRPAFPDSSSCLKAGKNNKVKESWSRRNRNPCWGWNGLNSSLSGSRESRACISQFWDRSLPKKWNLLLPAGSFNLPEFSSRLEGEGRRRETGFSCVFI